MWHSMLTTKTVLPRIAEIEIIPTKSLPSALERTLILLQLEQPSRHPIHSPHVKKHCISSLTALPLIKTCTLYTWSITTSLTLKLIHTNGRKNAITEGSHLLSDLNIFTLHEMLRTLRTVAPWARAVTS